MKKFLAIVISLALLAGFSFGNLACFAEDQEPADTLVPHKGEYALSDTSEGHLDENGNATGYWMNPFRIGDKLKVQFESPIWLNGFSFYAWCADCDVILDIELANENNIVVWSGQHICFGNNFQEVGFDRSFPPGKYSITFINVENPDYPGGKYQHFVLGSGLVRLDLEREDIIVTGYLACNTLGAPEIVLYEGDEDPDYVEPDPTPTPEIPDIPEETAAPVEKGQYALSDQSEGHYIGDVAAGYWMHPYNIGDFLEVIFTSPIWMDGFSFFAFCPYCDVYIDIELKNDKDQVVWTGRKICYGNENNEVSFDQSFPPGLYTLTFINAENPDYPEGINQHFVLGSGLVREDLEPDDIEVYGYLASNSLGAPEIVLFEGEADPNYVTPEPKPTATPKPAATPTNPPSEATPEPETGNPSETDGESSSAPAKKGCGGVVGTSSAILLLVSAAFIVKKKH